MISTENSHSDVYSEIADLRFRDYRQDYDPAQGLPLVDVHCHLTHKDYDDDRPELLEKLSQYGLKAVIVNGLEPHSNRVCLEMASQYPFVHAAAGIYPVEAVWDLMPPDHEYQPAGGFCVDHELGWIEDQAQKGQIIAVGECGFDGHVIQTPQTDQRQVEVLCELARIAQTYDLPLIVHSRKAERRLMETLARLRITRVLFHCYMGKVSLAVQGATDHKWHFSIPAIVPRHQGFQKMLRVLPADQILTETDSPYLSQFSGVRNDPRQVIYPVWALARAREWTYEQAAQVVWNNFQRFFDC